MKAETKLLIIFLLVSALLAITTEVHAETTNNIPHYNWFEDRAALYDVPLDIAIAVATVESNIVMVVSSHNSNGTQDIGIFQLNSNFIEWFEKALWYKDRDFDPYNAKDNIEMGIIYLRHLYNQTHCWDKAVKAFHIGLHALAYDPDKANIYLVKVSNVLSTLRVKDEK